MPSQYSRAVTREASSGQRPRLADALGGIALLVWLRRASRDDYTPEGIPALNEHDMAVLRAAHALATDERLSDDEAVSELVLMAGHHRNRLRKAEIAARRGGRYQDFAVANRARRLLKAAATGDPVTEPSPADRHRFEVVESFRALGPDRGWEQLVGAVPELAVVAEQQNSGAFDILMTAGDPSTPPDARAAAGIEASALLADAGARLDHLLGPKSGRSDPLLGSAYVRQFAIEYLMPKQTPPG